MTSPVVLLSVPGLRPDDLQHMGNLEAVVGKGERTPLVPSFPCVTWPVQSNMVCGSQPKDHGVVANGFFWRDTHQVEMWTAWNDKIQQPQVWDILEKRGKRCAVWFPMLSKGCGAQNVCMPAPVHNPDGSESLWCYTKPENFYGELLEEHGHFPLQNFWGPQTSIASSRWIVDSAITAAKRFKPDFFYIYIPHLDYAAQRSGPDSEQAKIALVELDNLLGKLFETMPGVMGKEVVWMVASEYAIVPVNHVSYPNRILREAGFLEVYQKEGEWIDFRNSQAWALVDHQFAHVYIKPSATDKNVEEIAKLFRGSPGIAEVLVEQEREKYQLHHPRSGEIVLISEPQSWQAYYYWKDDTQAPPFARTVDIHRKPGYDPVELFFDPVAKSIPLDATLVKGSHGAPATAPFQQGIFANSHAGLLEQSNLHDGAIHDYNVYQLILDQFQ